MLSHVRLFQPHGLQYTSFPCPSLSLELAQTRIHWVDEAIQPSHPLSSPSSPAFNLPQHKGLIFNESALRIRWPKHWSFSFSISPSNEYSGLISFTTDRFDLLAVQGTLKSLLQHHSTKTSTFGAQPSYWSSSHIHTWLLEKPQPWLYGSLVAKWYLCFLTCCLVLSWLLFQGASVFSFHGCSHYQKWFWSPRK